MTSIRNRSLFVPQQYFADSPPAADISAVIYRSKDSSERWIEETTETISHWKNLSRSIYLRWAITINAMYIAEKHYEALPNEKALQTVSIRSLDGTGQHVPIAVWSGEDTANHYRQSTELVAAYGVADLVGSIEDIIFEAFAIFRKHHPQKYIGGAENKALRKLYRNRVNAPDAWNEAWTEKEKRWRRNNLYKGLYSVMANYWDQTGLKRPKSYKQTNVQDWCDTVRMFSELRNLIVHSSSEVSPELAAYSKTPTAMTFNFKQDEPLHVELHHLQSIECFLDQYLCALNISLLERAG